MILARPKCFCSKYEALNVFKHTIRNKRAKFIKVSIVFIIVLTKIPFCLRSPRSR